MKNEVVLYNKMKECLPSSMRCMRVENNCEPGMLDVYMQNTSGSIFWLENKMCNVNAVLKLRPSQIIFALEHVKQYKGKAVCLIMTRKKPHAYYVLNFNEFDDKLFNRLLKDEMKLIDIINYELETGLPVVTLHKTMESVVKQLVLL